MRGKYCTHKVHNIPLYVREYYGLWQHCIFRGLRFDASLNSQVRRQRKGPATSISRSIRSAYVRRTTPPGGVCQRRVFGLEVCDHSSTVLYVRTVNTWEGLVWRPFLLDDYR